MIDDVDYEAQKTIDKVFPCPRLAFETAFQEMAINLGEDHACSPDVFLPGPPIHVPKVSTPPGGHLILYGF